MTSSGSRDQPPLDDAAREDLAAFIAEYQEFVRKRCKRILGNDLAAVEDAVHETFFRAARHVARLRGYPRSRREGWLALAARHASQAQTDWAPHKVKRDLTGEEADFGGNASDIDGNASDIDSMIRTQVLRYWMQRAKKTLTRPYQSLLPLTIESNDGQISLTEIADTLGISYYLAKVQMYRMTVKPDYLRNGLLTAYLADNHGAGCDDARKIVDAGSLDPHMRAKITNHTNGNDQIPGCSACQVIRKKLPRLLGIPVIFAIRNHGHAQAQHQQDVAYSQTLPPADARLAGPPQPAATLADTGAVPLPSSADPADDQRDHHIGLGHRIARLGASLAIIWALALTAIFPLHPAPAVRATAISARSITRPHARGTTSRAGTPLTAAQPLDGATPPNPVTGTGPATAGTPTGKTPTSGGKTQTHTPPPANTSPTPPANTSPTPPPVPDVSLSVSGATQLLWGQSAVLQVQLTSSLTGTPYVVRITDLLSGYTLQECTAGTTCQVSVESDDASVGEYSAEVDNSANGTIVGDQADPVTLNWYAPELTFSTFYTTPSSKEADFLSAKTNLTLTSSPYVVVIDDPSGKELARCTTGTDCQAGVLSSGANTYTAKLLISDSDAPPLQSITVTVTWPIALQPVH